MKQQTDRKESLEAFLKDCMERAAAKPLPFHVIIFNKLPTHRHNAGGIRVEVKKRTEFESLKTLLCIFVDGGISEENFRRNYEVVDLSKKEFV